MQVIYIENEFICRRDVEEALATVGCELIVCPPPPSGSELQGRYLQIFLEKVKELEPAFLFSMGYIPFLSLACGVMQLPYVCWLTEGYHRSYYDATIRNGWNYIFVADSVLCRELKSLGVANCYFLPLAAPVLVAAETQGYDADISCIGTVRGREELAVNPLSGDGGLKDATRGYLEGAIACRCQTRKLPPMCSKLPLYVWEDLIKVYPPQVDSCLEKVTSFYNHTYFDDMITYENRAFYLSALSELEQYGNIHHYSFSDLKVNRRIQNCGKADYYGEVSQIAQRSKINLVLSHYSLRAGIPAIAWAIMGAGGFLMSNQQKDYEILRTVEIVQFQDIHEMRRKANYYFWHEDERKDIVSLILAEIKKGHTYLHRVEEMFTVLSQ